MTAPAVDGYLMKYFESGLRLHHDQSFKRKKEQLTGQQIPFEPTEDPKIVKVILFGQPVWVWLLTTEEDPEGGTIKFRNETDTHWSTCSMDQLVGKVKHLRDNQLSGVIRWLDHNKIPYQSPPGVDFVILTTSTTSLYVYKGLTAEGLIPVSFDRGNKKYNYSEGKLLNLIGVRKKKIIAPKSNLQAQLLLEA